MKFEIKSWERGTAPIDKLSCVIATVICIPNWFSRNILGRKIYEKECYGEEHKWQSGWCWYFSDTGMPVDVTTYGNYDSWGAYKRLGDVLERHREMLMVQKKNVKMVHRIQNARKVDE